MKYAVQYEIWTRDADDQYKIQYKEKLCDSLAEAEFVAKKYKNDAFYRYDNVEIIEVESEVLPTA